MEISAKVIRGENAGTLLYPHLHKDGMFVVSKTRFERDYIRLADLHEVATYIADGYKVRIRSKSIKPRRACSSTMTDYAGNFHGKHGQQQIIGQSSESLCHLFPFCLAGWFGAL